MPWATRCRHTGTVAESLPSTFSLDALAQIVAAGGMVEEFHPLMAALRRWEATVPMWSSVLIHGDYHPDNILITHDGQPAVIDWSSATFADPRVDVANTMALFITNGEAERSERFLQAYETMGGRPLPDMDFKGPSVVGLKPGIEVELRRQAPAWTPLVRLVEERAGVALPGVHRHLG